jgi:peptide-methionine (R)-S-oxide reductase
MRQRTFASFAISSLAGTIGGCSCRLFWSKKSDTADMSRQRSAASHTALPGERDGSKDKPDAEWRQALNQKQYAVLRQKGTDRPHQGEYDDFYKSGKYLCAACGSLLYTSVMKFNCGCGWPGFYDCCPKAVREEPDEDGRRVEILCNACNGHLGHVFRGEGFGNPAPDERHCVNSTSIRFVPESEL